MEKYRDYRGKRLDTGEWVYGYYWKVPKNDEFDLREQFNISNEKGSFEVDPETVGQATRLKDKNGKKAYFNDLVKLRGPKEIFRIVQDDFGIPLFITNKGHVQVDFKDYFAVSGRNDFEIIGTVFENPELLEEGNDV